MLEASGIGTVESFIFEKKENLKASYSHVRELADWLKDRPGIPIAVGSGTVNDLCKRACGELGRPYAVLATAASMDGYCSQGAAVLKDGLKQTLPCPAPVLVAADPGILAAAPPDMAASGYADLAAKQCSGLDWILADRLGADENDEIDALTWRMVFEGLDDRLSRAAAVGQGDPEAISSLFEGLAATGFALQYYGASRPASGTEHQFSHVLEMEGWEHEGSLPSHGFKVGIGSLASLRMYAALLEYLEEPGKWPEGARPADEAVWIEARLRNYPTPEEEERECRRLYPDQGALPSIREVMSAKRPTMEVLSDRLARLLEDRESIAAALRKNMPDYGVFRERLKAAGAPAAAMELGLSSEKVKQTLLAARLIRNRYGGLDLAYELGILDEVAERVAGEI